MNAKKSIASVRPEIVLRATKRLVMSLKINKSMLNIY